jgi:hypothetical protein
LGKEADRKKTHLHLKLSIQKRCQLKRKYANSIESLERPTEMKRCQLKTKGANSIERAFREARCKSNSRANMLRERAFIASWFAQQALVSVN